MRRLKTRERKLNKGDTSHLKCIEEQDLVYLYDTFWQGRSALWAAQEGGTGSGDSKEQEGAGGGNSPSLVLTRWNLHLPFSPTNSVLLTRGEAIRHEQGKNDYPPPIVQWIEAKNERMKVALQVSQ